MVYKLYRTPLPRDAIQAVEPSVQRQLAQAGVLSGGSSVENIVGQPSDLQLRGDYRGKYAERLGVELKELLESDQPALPLYNDGSDDLAESGYYTIERGSAARVNPRSDRLATFDGALVRKGSRASTWRAVETNSTQPSPGNDFGTATTAEIGVPAAATKVRWLNPETRALTEATVVETRTAEFGDIDVVDEQNVAIDTPTLIYDLPYGLSGDLDVSVWDAFGVAKTDVDGVTAWQRVFDPGHDYRGASVLDTGLLRVTADDATQSLSAETWDTGTSSWTALALGVSDWELYDWDVRSIGGITTELVAEFRDPTVSPTAYYALRGVVTRGTETVQWLIPANEPDPVPQGLKDLLSPIAGDSVVVPGATAAFVDRAEVR